MTGTFFNPEVSIIIPVYNGADYLREAVDSALNQSYTHVEVIVVNDGSDDENATENIAKSYGERIRYFLKQNGGVASALNLGISKMKGEYFSWLSHDDVYYPEKIEVQIDYLRRQETRNLILYSDYDVIDDHSKFVSETIIPHYTPDRFLYELVQGSFLHGCTLLVPKVCFEKVGVFNEQLATTQDYDLWVKMSKHYSFIHLPQKLIKSRTHGRQGSRQQNHVKDLDDFYVACLEHLEADAIRRVYKTNASAFYRKLAGRYRRRNLMEAYQAASRRANSLAEQELGPVRRKVREFLDHATGFAVGCIPSPLLIMKAKFRAGVHHSVNRVRGGTPAQTKFTDIYARNLFGGAVSKSGPGSDLMQTRVIRQAIPELVKELRVKVFMDAPCGDFYWMKETALGVDQYIGVDVVQNVVDRNKECYSDPTRSFFCMDIMEDKLPSADLIMCRDLLVHLTFEQAKRVIWNFKRSGAMYLLTTTFTDRKTNADLKVAGSWRPLNLERAPLSFPKPMKIINENCTENNLQYHDKSLGLWRLDDLVV